MRDLRVRLDVLRVVLSVAVGLGLAGREDEPPMAGRQLAARAGAVRQLVLHHPDDPAVQLCDLSGSESRVPADAAA